VEKVSGNCAARYFGDTQELKKREIPQFADSISEWQNSFGMAEAMPSRVI